MTILLDQSQMKSFKAEYLTKSNTKNIINNINMHLDTFALLVFDVCFFSLVFLL